MPRTTEKVEKVGPQESGSFSQLYGEKDAESLVKSELEKGESLSSLDLSGLSIIYKIGLH